MMFTDNYWTAFNLAIAGASPVAFYNQNYKSYDTAGGTLISYDGITKPYLINRACVQNPNGGNLSTMCAVASNNRQLYRGWVVKLGTSDEEGDRSDYRLKEDVTSSFNITTSISSGQGDGSLYNTFFNINGINNSANDITIKEIGITKSFNFGTSAYNGQESPSTYTSAQCLLARYILPEPITVNAGATFALSLLVKNQ